jgi:hypothetical protein
MAQVAGERSWLTGTSPRDDERGGRGKAADQASISSFVPTAITPRHACSVSQWVAAVTSSTRG